MNIIETTQQQLGFTQSCQVRLNDMEAIKEYYPNSS